MPIKIPSDAKVIKESRLTPIRAICTLHDGHVKKEGGLSDQVKLVMEKKGAEYAESDLVIARLGEKKQGEIDVRKALTLCLQKNVTIQKFLGCCSITKKALKDHLSEAEIESITTYTSSVSLTTEFKPAFAAVVNSAELCDAIGDLLASQMKKLAAA